MLSPRWSKVTHDLWANKTRTILAVLSIAVGVFAIGMIGGSYEIMTRDLNGQYLAINPASAIVYPDWFDEELVRTVERMPGVAEAEGRRFTTMRIKVGDDEWRSIELAVIEDFDRVEISQVRPESGAWPPPERTLLIERSGLGLLGNPALGSPVQIEMPDGRVRELPISGIAHDISGFPAIFSGSVSGFMSADTAEWLGLGRGFTALYLTVEEHKLDREHITAVVEDVRGKIEGSGRTVYWTRIPPPGESPVNNALVTMSVVLAVLGVLLVILSGFLVTNTVSAVLMQQTRQIGVMKAIGASTRSIVGMYLVLVLLLGVLAFALALPLGALAAYAMSAVAASMFNFNLVSFRFVPWVVVLQAIVSLLVPLLASLVPVLSGTRLTVREAIASYGLGKGRFGKGLIDRALERVRFLSRPLVLSLRNTFRRKGRLALTLITLTLGGVIFITVFCVQDSMARTTEDIMNYFAEDVRVEFGRGYRDDQVAQVVGGTRGVVGFESWTFIGTRRIRPDDTESNSIVIVAPPSDTKLVRPNVVQGRWLLPEDQNAIVIETAMQREEPDAQVGTTIRLKIGDRLTDWTIVGVFPSIGNGGGFSAYANAEYAAQVNRSVGQTGNVRIVTAEHDAASQQVVARELERRFREAGLRATSISTNSSFRAQLQSQFNIIVVFLAIMAALITLVGALGLMGTMSMNVIERTREIGVLRAIGASNGAVMQIVIAEGVMIGMVSWALGALLSIPLSRLLSDQVGLAFLRSPLNYTFSYGGVLVWLLLVVVLGMLASALPAWNASRLTVRDVLSYEG